MLLARQRSAWSGFEYDVFTADGSLVGELAWPLLAQAKNARLKWHDPGSKASDISLRYRGAAWRIRFEYLTRGMVNDTRFTLEDDNGVTAVVDFVFGPERLSRRKIEVRQPFEGKVVRASRLWQTRYTVERQGREIGRIHEPRWFSIKRELHIDLPADIEPALQIFLFFIVANSAYR